MLTFVYDYSAHILVVVLLAIVVLECAAARCEKREAAAAKEVPAGWVQWAGAGSPVEDTAFVEVEHRDGRQQAGYAWRFTWLTRGRPEDIVAYREVN